MPFTFAHPAIVLPLTYLPRHWFSISGLVTGSIIPDFEYFIRMKVQSNYSHSISGLFWFDLPLALLIAFVYHNIVRNKLLDNLPQAVGKRVTTFKYFNWNKNFQRNWYVVILSILIGAGSHLLWDRFTHADTYFTATIPALSNSVSIFDWQIPGYKILQHFSTLLGAVIIAIAIFRLPKNNHNLSSDFVKYWSIIAGITFMIIAVRLFSALDIKQYGDLIVTAISAFLVAIILTPVLIGIRSKVLPQSAQSPQSGRKV